MTYKVAIQWLKGLMAYEGRLSPELKALDMAIEALKEDEKNAKYGSELARIVAEHDAADELMKKAEEERIYE